MAVERGSVLIVSPNREERIMVGDKLQNYGGQYSKWQEKYYSAIKENPMATELNRLKIMSQARLNRLSGKVDNTKKMAGLLQDLGKRRGY